MLNKIKSSFKSLLPSKTLYLKSQSTVKPEVLLVASAFIWQLTFLFPEYCGFLIFLTPVSLIPLFIKNRRYKEVFYEGIIWGALLFAPHFLWFLELLLKKSEATISLSVVLYSVLIGWFMVTSGVWFILTSIITQKIKTRLMLILFLYASFISYFIVIEQRAFFPLALKDGYPFVSPLLPLAHYKMVLKAVRYFGLYYFGMNAGRPQSFKEVVLVHCQPERHRESLTPNQLVKKLLKTIKQQNCAAKSNQNFLFLAPESTLPFSLHKHQEVVNLLQQGLPQNTQLLVGSLSQTGTCNKQTIYNVHLGLIKNCYDKQHLIWGVETNQTALGEWLRIEQPFLKGRCQFVSGSKSCFDDENYIFKTIKFVPIICSELFFKPIKTFYHEQYHDAWFIFFINDSWYNDFFCSLIMRKIQLQATMLGHDIVVVGHKKITFISGSLG